MAAQVLKEKAHVFQTTIMNKSLSSMVKGIRAHKDDEQEYIAKQISSIKDELRSSYPDVKATALRKLIYLQMHGVDIEWAAFHVVEVMSAAWFGHKRVGYLAASLSFGPDTDVILLTTHEFRKAFQGGTSRTAAQTAGLRYETGAAINCLANIVTEGLAQDLLSDIYGMMNSSQPYIRKKAILVLLKIFQRWPKALRMSFDRLKEKLKDEDQSVVSAAVYVLCELAGRNPQNYLGLAPVFFNILTHSSNNWVLIKVVKLLGSLVPLEPRLAKKLDGPLTSIISTTPAKSLMYECINTLLSGQRLQSKDTARLVMEKLRDLVEDLDQNLKYLGLLGLSKMMKLHPRYVAEHKDLILDCLNDDDATIRIRALDLVSAMANERNLRGIVKRLIAHLDEAGEDGSTATYREQVLRCILELCARDNYALVDDFEWHIATLIDLTHIQGVSLENARRLRDQIMDVVVRVPGIRRFAVGELVDLLLSERLSQGGGMPALAGGVTSGSTADQQLLLGTGAGGEGMTEVLYAAAWVAGEFSNFVIDEHPDLLLVMMKPGSTGLSSNVQNVFLQAVLKIYTRALNLLWRGNGVVSEEELREQLKGDESEEYDSELEEEEEEEEQAEQQPDFRTWWLWIRSMTETLLDGIPVFTLSPHVEVQERAVAYLGFLRWMDERLGFGLSPPEASPASAAAREAGDPEEEAASPAIATETKDDSLEAEKAEPRDPDSFTEEERLGVVDVAQQLASLFEEPLPAVRARAQRKVPVPDGLDLDAWINEPESSDSEDSDWSSEEDDLEDLEEDRRGGRDGRRRQGSRKRQQRKSKRSKRRRHRMDLLISDSESEEEEWRARPATEEEKRAARERQEAERARRAHDPFYIGVGDSGDRGQQESAADLPDIQELSGDDLPELKVAGGRGRRSTGPTKISELHAARNRDRRRRNKGTGRRARQRSTRRYRVADLDGEEDESEEDRKKSGSRRNGARDALDMDLDGPLGEDEIISAPKPYAQYSPATAAAAAANTPTSTPDRDKEGRRRRRRRDGKSKDKDGRRRRRGETTGGSDRRKQKKKKEKASTDTDGKRRKEPKSDSGDFPTRYLVKDRLLRLSYTLSADTAGGDALLQVTALCSRDLPGLKLELSAQKGTAWSLADPGTSGAQLKLAQPHQTQLRLPKGLQRGPKGKQDIVLKLSRAGKSAELPIPQTIRCRVTYSTGGEGKDATQRITSEIHLSWAPWVRPHTLSDVGKFTELSRRCAGTSSRRIELSGIGVQEALKRIGQVLGVGLVNAANYTAMYCGRLTRPGKAQPEPVCVLVKAQKGNDKSLQASVKSVSQEVADSLIQELVDRLQ